MSRLRTFVLSAIVALAACVPSFAQSTLDQIGWTALQNRLGASMPNGAGVPVMGSNMIDQKQQTYRLPAGRYRPLGFTVACNQMPYREGLVCTKGFAEFPTGFYASGEPVFEVAAGQMTTAGDFIVEYTGPIPPAGTSLFDVDAEPHQWQLRWREGEQTLQGFETLTLNRPSVPEEWRSRITCNRRPEGVTLYIPFAC